MRSVFPPPRTLLIAFLALPGPLAAQCTPGIPCVPAGAPPGLVYGGTSQCQLGTITCPGPICEGWVGPSAEVCDGIDNDCNGVVDDGVPGVGTHCGINLPPCSVGITACVNGALVCQGGVLPQPEICNGVDDDCNGVPDDGVPGVGEPCGTDVGACASGILVCAGGESQCVGGILPAAEACNGVDDDCDGVIDNGFVPNTPCAPVAAEPSLPTPTGFTANWAASYGSTSYRLDICTDEACSAFAPGYQDLDVGAVTSFGVTGLVPGAAYWYRVRGWSEFVAGPSSNLVTVALWFFPVELQTLSIADRSDVDDGAREASPCTPSGQ